MKQVFLPVLILFFASVSLFSETYFYINKKGTETAYNFLTTGYVLVPRGSNDVLSNPYNIPFPWKFFGKSVTQYKASDNGYITFDMAETVSKPNNTELPSADAPKNAIFAFWDDLELKAVSNNTNIKTECRCFTYGDAPNRVHVIQWFTASPQGVTITTSSNFAYFAIRLFESGNFDIVENYGYTASPLTGTIGIQNDDATVGVMVPGSPNLAFPNVISTQYSNAVDKIYEFHPGEQQDLDASVILSTIPKTVSKDQPVSIKGRIMNFGKTAIANMTLNYQVEGGEVVSHKLSSLNITASGGTYNFNHKTKWTPAESGRNYSLKIWASELNTGADMNNQNDTLTVSVFANNGVFVEKNVLLEEGTGGWCGFCPDGHLIMRDILKSMPNVIGAVHHDGDGMVNPQSDSINTAYATGYPYGIVDRALFSDQAKVGLSRTTWSAKVVEKLNSATPVTLTIDRTYNPDTRKIDFTVNASFPDYAQGEMRFNAFILEDFVRGPDIQNTWTQHSYYASEGSAVGGSTHELYNEPEWLVGYWHNHVVRKIPSGTWGTPGIIPSLVKPGETYSASYSWTIPAEMEVSYNNPDIDTKYQNTSPGIGMNKPQDIHLVAFITYYNGDPTQREVLNTVSIPLLETGVDGGNDAANQDVNIYPNPVNELGSVSFNIDKPGRIKVELMNSLGEREQFIQEGDFLPGNHVLYFDASQLSQGAYFINITSDGKPFNSKGFIVK